MGTYCVPIRTNSLTAGNFASQFIPVARIDIVPPGRMRSAPAANSPVVKIPGLASPTLVSTWFERPAAVSTAISSEVEGGTAGQRKSIRSDASYKTGDKLPLIRTFAPARDVAPAV